MYRFFGKLFLPLPVIVLTIVLFLFSGCAVHSGPRNFAKPQASQTRPATDAPEKLARAFETTAREGKKFWFSGWQMTKIQK
ncbi:MAG: hypothetical protein ACYC21_15710, partial [Eubacteriales bacterium]